MSAYRLVILAILAAICALSSAASTVHHVRFAQPAMLMVWEDGVLIGQGQQIDLTGLGAVDRPSLLGSGELIQSNETIGQSKIISIASNAGFEIRTSNTMPDQGVSVSVRAIGENAQARANAIESDRESVFTLTERTAARPGAPESQSITLEIEWTGSVAPNLYVTAL